MERPDTDLLLVALGRGDAWAAEFFSFKRKGFQSGAFDFCALYCLSAKPEVECVNVWLRLGWEP